ncbi:MAG: efflux RND transporter permease subunit [Magnetospiraceae bacterium]
MIGFFVRHPNAGNLLMGGLMFLGLMSLPDLQRETFPRITPVDVEIRAVYPGATAEEVEDGICRSLEDALEGINGLEDISCEAREGVAIAVASMGENEDMSRFLADVTAEVDAIDDFPENVETPVIAELGREDLVVSLAVTGPDRETDLKTYAESLKDRLMALEDVADVSISGFSDRQIRVEVPADVLNRYGVSMVDVANAVDRRSVAAPIGRLEGQQEDFLLRFDDRRKTVDALRDLVVVAGGTGTDVRLGDIATIEERFDRPEERIEFNGARAAVLDIYKSRTMDTLRSMDAVTAFVAAERESGPPGITLTLTRDLSSIVRDRLNMLVKNGAQGLVLVFLILWLFFSMRYGFWVAMGLPVSFLGTFFLMPLLGMTVNMLTMVGLLIATGLLMDDAIVIAENIATRLAKGEPPAMAAANGAREVLPGVLSSFSTTLLVFGALAFIEGNLGQVLRVVPIVLIATLAVSLVEAFLILPGHLFHSLRHIEARESGGARAYVERGFNRLRDNWFGPFYDRAISFRYLTVGVSIMLVIIAVSMLAGGVLKVRGFPDIDGDVIEARIMLPQGTPLERTEAVVKRLTDELAKVNARFKPDQPEGQDLVRNVLVIYGQNPDAYETGPHVARLSVDLLGAEIRGTELQHVLNAWRDGVGALPDVLALTFTEPSHGPAGRAIQMRLSGSDLDQLKAASGELLAWLESFDGVIDLTDDLRPGKRELTIHLREGSGIQGLDAKAVSDQVRAAFQGRTVDEFNLGAESVEVDVRLAEQDRLGPDDLSDFIIVAPNGSLVPLVSAARVEMSRGWARINRVNGERSVVVLGNVDTDITNTSEVIRTTRTEFFPDLLKRYPGITYAIEGEAESSGETSASMGRNMLFGLVGVFLLLAFQFRSYLLPLTVMIVIPTAIVGVVFGHLLMGIELSMPSLVGLASLAGIVVNNSILLVQFTESHRLRGMAAEEAARQAGRARFRPIIMTTLTTVVGLLPLLSETSMQAQVLIPLATSLAFGLAFTTLIALFLTPALYCIFKDWGLVRTVEQEEIDTSEAADLTPA